MGERKDLMHRLIESEEVLWLEELVSWQGGNSSAESDGMFSEMYHHESTMARYQSLSSELINKLQVMFMCETNSVQPCFFC